MLYIGFFKRVIPFVLTFAAGLFIASFFVSIIPNFSGWAGEGRRGRCREKRQMQVEMNDLRDKLRTLRHENQELRRSADDFELVIPNAVPPVEMEAPHPPTPPRRPKHPRFE